MNQSAERIRITICVPTYRRPNELRRLLENLTKSSFGDALDVDILIVDNDEGASGREVVRSILGAEHRLRYVIETTKGISHARNRALAEADSSQYIAFIDDDEVPEQGWLHHLVAAARKYSADVVFGPVIRILPDNAPRWSRNHPSFGNAHLSSGELVRTGGAGNVLIKQAACRDARTGLLIRFDERYSQTGGEDTDFFYRLHQAGKRMTWCAEAVAREIVLPERLNIRWAFRRSFLTGKIYASVFHRDASAMQRYRLAAYKASQIICGVLLLAPAVIVSTGLALELLGRMTSSVGQICILMRSSK